MNAFEGPASAVVIGKVVPKEKLEQVSGMNSFSGNLVAILSPVFAASLFAWGGLDLILVIDLMSFIFAFLVLIFIVIITMALLNFFSRLTYENILSPMILSRSANDSTTLGIVNTVMGIGGIVGGIIVSTGKVKANSAKMIYIFLCTGILGAMFSYIFYQRKEIRNL